MRIRSRLGLAFAGQVLLTIALGVGAAVALDHADEHFMLVAEHQPQVMENARQLIKLVIDMETGVRGYCITAEDAFLEPYASGSQGFREVMAAELALVAGAPEKVAALEGVSALVERWRRTVAEPEIAMTARMRSARAKAQALRVLLSQSPGPLLMARSRAIGRELRRAFADAGDWRGAYAASVVEAALIEMESAHLGFLATGDGGMLRRSEEAGRELPARVDEARALAAARGLDARPTERLDGLVAAWLTRAAAPEVAARQAVNASPESSEDVAAVVAQRTGKALVDEIRRTLAAFTAAEAVDASAHYVEAEAVARATLYGIIAVLVAAIGLGIGLAWSTSRAIARPVAALIRGTERLARGDFRARVQLDTVDEVEALGRAFDDMARQLEQAASSKERAEAALFAMRNLESLGTLAGGIAHDFNNILTGIVGNLSLAEEWTDPADELHEVLAEARKAASSATGLTRQLLTFAKGGQPVLRSIAPGPLLAEVATFASRGSHSKCVFDLPDDLNPIRVDPGQISQVVQNLVLNAAQAMPEGGTIRVSARNCESAEGGCSPGGGLRWVCISVADEGVGIPPDAVGKIFDPYFSTKAGGQGLGLAMAYSIVTRHGGTIAVESRAGAGTTFTIRLPAAESIGSPAAGPSEGVPAGGGRVLVMDDDETVVRTLARMLNALGYACEVAPDGLRAVAAYEAAAALDRPFDAVIMDLTIPSGIGGKETVRRLRAIDPAVRAIASSGYSNDPVMADPAGYGFDGVLTKPYTLQAVAEALASVS